MNLLVIVRLIQYNNSRCFAQTQLAHRRKWTFWAVNNADYAKNLKQNISRDIKTILTKWNLISNGLLSYSQKLIMYIQQSSSGASLTRRYCHCVALSNCYTPQGRICSPYSANHLYILAVAIPTWAEKDLSYNYYLCLTQYMATHTEVIDALVP